MGRVIEFKNYQQFLKAERKVPWQYLIYRNQSMLLNSLMMRGYATRKYYKDLFGINYAWDRIKDINNYFWYDLKHVSDIQRIGAKMGTTKIKWAIRECYRRGDKILADSFKIRRKDLSKISTKEFFKILDRYKKDIQIFSIFIIYPTYAYDKPYEEKIREYLRERNIKNVDEAVGVLTYPVKKNLAYYERYNFLSLVLNINKNQKLKKVFQEKTIKAAVKELEKYPRVLKMIKNHIYEYGWLQCRNYHGHEWSLEEMAERIKTVLPEAKKDFKELADLEKKMARDYKILMKKLKITGDILNTIKISKELVYQRTYRTDVLHKSGFNIRNLLTEIGKRFGYSFTDMIHMRIEDIMHLPEDQISRKDIAERKKGFTMVAVDGKMNWFWGKDAEKYEKELKEFKKSQKRKTEIKGVIANKGITKGIVSIVKTVDDLPNVKKGDILVAPMTFPSFIPAMEKAAAFVTNEGGILCHAAIVSREINKPCVIGTENATEVLRNGEIVEVDANKGIVRILK